MKHLRYFVVVLAVSFVQAQTKQPSKSTADTSEASERPIQRNPATSIWTREPTTFFGVKYGAPLSQSVNECPKKTEYGQTSYVFNPDGPMCYQNGYGLVTLEHINMFFDVFVTEVDGAVGAIAGNCREEYNDTVIAALIEKFGPPTTKTTKAVQNKAGASYSKTSLFWAGRDISIRFETIGSRVDQGFLIVSNKAYDASLLKQQSRQQKSLTNTF